MSLTTRILIGMIAGFLLGSVLHGLDLSATHPIRAVFVDGFLDVGGKIFIASLKLLVVPLVFVSLVCGASNLSDGAAMGQYRRQGPWPLPFDHGHCHLPRAHGFPHH